jgi:hypothetical protein
MGLKLYLTIAAVVAILYALAFLLIPIQASLLFSRLRRTPRGLVLAVLRRRSFGVGTDCLVREGLPRLARSARSSHREHRGAGGQYHSEHLSDFSGLAKRECLGIDCCAGVTVARRHLSTRSRRGGSLIKPYPSARKARAPTGLLSLRRRQRG